MDFILFASHVVRIRNLLMNEKQEPFLSDFYSFQEES